MASIEQMGSVVLRPPLGFGLGLRGSRAGRGEVQNLARHGAAPRSESRPNLLSAIGWNLPAFSELVLFGLANPLDLQSAASPLRHVALLEIGR